MSVNCIRCVRNKRTGPDLLCDACRAGQGHGADHPLAKLRDRVLEIMAEQDRPLDAGAVGRLAGATEVQAGIVLEHLVAHGQAEYQATGWYVLKGRAVVNAEDERPDEPDPDDGATVEEIVNGDRDRAHRAEAADILREADQQLDQVRADLFGNPVGPAAVCQRCKRPLSDPVSQAAGMGPVCRARASVGGGDADNPSTVSTLPWDPATMDVVLQRTPPRLGASGGDAAANICQVVVHHSPTGFNWGYGGSGPADLALNVCQLFVPADGEPPVKCYRGTCSQTAWNLHQHFKRTYVATMPDAGGTIPGATIRQWLLDHGVPADRITGPISQDAAAAR